VIHELVGQIFDKRYWRKREDYRVHVMNSWDWVKEGTEEDRKGYKRKHKSKLFQKIELQKKNRWSV
jgi:hypothetical protein